MTYDHVHGGMCDAPRVPMPVGSPKVVPFQGMRWSQRSRDVTKRKFGGGSFQSDIRFGASLKRSNLNLHLHYILFLVVAPAKFAPGGKGRFLLHHRSIADIPCWWIPADTSEACEWQCDQRAPYSCRRRYHLLHLATIAYKDYSNSSSVHLLLLEYVE